MTLYRYRNVILFECDECREGLNTGVEDFHEAVQVLRRQGWTAFPTSSTEQASETVWKHRCIDCRARRAG